MFRKSVLLAALAVTLAAGSAFANVHVTGQVSRVNPAGGNIWLNTGMEFGIGTAAAQGLLPGDTVSITYADYNHTIDVLSTSPASRRVDATAGEAPRGPPFADLHRTYQG